MDNHEKTVLRLVKTEANIDRQKEKEKNQMINSLMNMVELVKFGNVDCVLISTIHNSEEQLMNDVRFSGNQNNKSKLINKTATVLNENILNKLNKEIR